MPKRVFAWCGLFYVGYLWWVWPRIGLPMLADEVQFSACSQRSFADIVQGIPHPIGYIGLLRTLVWFGIPEGPWLRIVGVVSFGITLMLVAYLAHRLTPRAGGLAAALWAMHPMAIQGSLILEIDTALLTCAMTAYAALLIGLPPRLSAKQLVWLGAALAGCLWVKLSCLPFLLLAVAARTWSEGKWSLGFRQAAQVAGLAGGLFVASWTAVASLASIPWMSIFQWVVDAANRGLQGPVFSWGLEFLNRLVRVGLWMNPWLLIFLVLAVLAIRNVPRAERWRWWCVASLVGSIIIGYLLVRGTHFGFAKYHLPALPVAVALIAAMVMRMIDIRKVRTMMVLGVIGVGYFWWVGDLLYDVNCTLRRALVTGYPAVNDILRALAIRGIWYLLPGIVVMIVAWRAPTTQRWRFAITGLAVLLIGSNLALDLRQRQASYATTYTYGRPWASFYEAVQWVSSYRLHHPHDEVVGPVDVLWLSGVSYATWVSLSLPDGGETIQQAAENPAVGCLMYGTVTHDLKAWRDVLSNPVFLERLQRVFHSVKLGNGEYTVWIRNRAIEAS